MSTGTGNVEIALLQRVVALVRRVLGKSPAEVGEDCAFGVTPGWDSLAHLNILTVLEQEFGVTIEPEEAVDLASAREIATFLAARRRVTSQGDPSPDSTPMKRENRTS